MAYGPIYLDLLRNSAIYVDRILKGAKPGDLPIYQATTFELVVNLKTAKALGFDFGLPESNSVPVPPSPTSTVYEVVDSPTVPDYILAEDEPPIFDVVRNHEASQNSNPKSRNWSKIGIF